MKLVLLYGVQATGKLTAAKELCQLTEFKLLHNHLILDLTSSVFPYHTDAFNRLTKKFWLDIMKEGIKENIKGIVTTFVFGEGIGMDNQFTQVMIQTVKSLGGEICPVLLTCNEKELLKRVGNESRKQYGKLRDADEFKKLVDKYDISRTIPNIDSFVIDTTTLPPEKTAQKIIDHYSL
jgi:tRNA uridine 5-carbamoylmethylation protein Kti12